jgi:cytochrome c oxidase assembly factor CtaG
MLFLHPGQPVAPHDIWTSWQVDPLLLGSLVGLMVFALRSRRRPHLGWLWIGIGALALALMSPLEAMSGSLASAHMVQHLLLILVGAPALVAAGATGAVFAGLPMEWRRQLGRTRRRLGLVPVRARKLANPLLAWLAHAGALLFWHAAKPYQGAMESTPIHYLEHLTFILTALWFWHAVQKGEGIGILMVFTMAMQGVFLALLMTFAEKPWYPAYETTAPLWGLTALSDQHLAGVIMWVPAGLVYTGVGLALLMRWLRNLSVDESSIANSAAGVPY